MDDPPRINNPDALPFIPIGKAEEYLFHEVFLDRGGMFPSEELGEFSKEVYTIISSTTQFISRLYPQCPKVIAGVVHNHDMGACSRLIEDWYFIALNLGTIILLEQTFSLMLASPQILPSCGDAFKEHGGKNQINRVRGAHDLYGPHDYSHPQCPIRGGRALRLFYLAVESVVLHECAHVVHGHLKYKSTSGVDPAQAFEMDADRFFTYWSVRYAAKEIELSKNNSSYKSRYSSWEEFAFDWAFAMYTSFRLQEFHSVPIESAAQLKHPLPQQRMAFVNWHLIECLRLVIKDAELFESVSQIVYKALREAESAIHQVTNSTMSQGDEFTAMYSDKSYVERAERICEEWADVRSALLSLAYGPLPPALRFS
jgi:hypothetical protein